MATLFRLPKVVPIDSGGAPYAGAKLTFYLTGTTTETDTYTTSALSVAHTNPVVADASGVFAPIYLNPQITYKATLTQSDDTLIYTVDPVSEHLTAADIGAVLYARTAAEIAAGVTPTNYHYEEGIVDRYGTNTTPGTTNMATAVQAALNVSANGGGPARFLSAVYGVGSSGWAGLSLDTKSGFSIVGEKGATIKVLAQPSQTQEPSSVSWTTLLKLESCTDFVIEGLDFDGNDIDTGAIGMDNCDRWRVTGNRFYDFDPDGDEVGFCIYTVRADFGEITGNHFENCGGCIYGGHTDANYYSGHLTISSNRANDIWRNFFVGVIKDITISNNVMENLGQSGSNSAIAFAAYDVTAMISENVLIVGNVIDGSGSQCIQSDIAGTIQAEKIVIQGNYCANGSTGIYVPQIKNSSISNNVIIDCDTGIYFDPTSEDTSIAGNVLDSTAITPSGPGGIMLHAQNTSSAMKNIAITGNRIKGWDQASQVGIRVTKLSTGTGEGISITGNVCTDNDYGLAIVAGYSNVIVESNVFLDNGTLDISSSPTTGVIFGKNIYSTASFASNSTETVTGTATCSLLFETTYIDSSGGAVTATLPDGEYNGQQKRIGMSNASNSSTLSVVSHETSSPEVFTFAQTTDSLVLEWDAPNAYWYTLKNIGVAT